MASRPTGIGARLFKVAAIVMAAMGAIWLSLAVTLADLGGGLPDLGWTSASAQAKAAERLLRPHASRAELSHARTLAEDAIQREPVNIVGVRTLGVIVGLLGDMRRAERLFLYAESLSRRDAPTQLWLIEREVTRDSIDGALLHYDRAMRTSLTSRTLLVPVLIRASADPSVARPLAERMAQRPPWWHALAEPLVASSRSPAALAYIIGRMRLDRNDDLEGPLLVSAMQRLVALGAPEKAYRLYIAAAADRADAREILRDGGFEGHGESPPFEWQLVDETDLAAIRRPREGGGRGGTMLALIARNGRSGPVALQLLVLRPGAYLISGSAGNVAGGPLTQPLITLTCTDGARASLLQHRLAPAGPGGSRFSARFSVPANGCGGQALAIAVASDVDGEDREAWIDDLVMRRISGG